jgi:hypothetical protein
VTGRSRVADQPRRVALTYVRAGPVANLMACLTVDEPEGRLIDVELDGDELARLLAGETVTVASR